MSRIKRGSVNDIIRRVYEKLDGKVSENDITRIVNMFWGPIGILKYIRGFKSFSVNYMFFFSVNRNKLKQNIEEKIKAKKKYNKKYLNKNKKKLLKKKK